jgi:hypothetical protein
MPKVTSHIHKLKKHKYKTGSTVFFCTLPDCHFKIDAALALGKRALCPVCNEEFIINEYTIKLVKPHCDKCGKVKVKDANGETRYVKKASNKILSGIATSTAEDLRTRLDSTVSPILEDDI